MQERKQQYKKKNGGFTMFFAVLVATLALAVGLAIYNLTSRELDISAVTTQSLYAIYAADAGVECGLYWDTKYWNGTATTTAFATSSASSAPGSALFCESQDITRTFAFPSPPANPTANAATTTFSIQFSGQPYCAQVSVAKYIDATNVPRTTIQSYGFNTCVNSQTRVERELQASY
jgi:hypothetical protein